MTPGVSRPLTHSELAGLLAQVRLGQKPPLLARRESSPPRRGHHLRVRARPAGAAPSLALRAPCGAAPTARDRTDGEAQFKQLINMWIEDEDYSPEYDSAIRDWARRSPEVAHRVHKVDNERIRLIERIFHNLGFAGLEAHIRPRVIYYHLTIKWVTTRLQCMRAGGHGDG